MAAAATSIEQPHPEEEEEASWSELPSDLVYMIIVKLSSSPHLMMFEYIRFGSVCTTWNFLFHDHNPPPQPPLLMIPHSLNKKKKRHRTRLRRFYNVCDNKIDSSLQVSMPRYRHCRGSSHGWLITVDYDENNGDDYESLFSIRLLNPFMGTGTSSHEILLPSLYTFPYETPYLYTYLAKAVLSANPITNPTDHTVMSIYGGSYRLAFLKPGDKVWTDVKLAMKMNEDNVKDFFEDIIYWLDEFYAIQRSGRIVVCKELDAAEGGGMAAFELTQPPNIEYKLTKKYLVTSSSKAKLMQVHRDIEDHLAADGRTLYSTVGFRVFELLILDEKEGDGITTEDLYNWVEVKSLCGDTMFLGHNASISISASNHPGCKPNCIYYTDDCDYFYVLNEQIGPHDMGVFNLEDGSFQRHFPIDPKITSLQPISIWPVPIWIQPTVPKIGSNNAASTSSDEEEEE